VINQHRISVSGLQIIQIERQTRIKQIVFDEVLAHLFGSIRYQRIQRIPAFDLGCKPMGVTITTGQMKTTVVFRYEPVFGGAYYFNLDQMKHSPLLTP
jgi:hypothetical protein